ncbi:hypothetical protein [Methylobacterium tarhaniae]|uniref:hypothetical protein n=1 Tax=Methylobacterium tarhaniae TaxID=1187852 RepID=UPI003D0389F0
MGALASAQYVGTGVALVAFAVSAALIAYRANLKQNTRAIDKAPPDQIVRVLRELAGKYGIPTEHLTNDQAANVITDTLKLRRFYASVVFLIALLIAAVAIVAVMYSDKKVASQNIGPVRLRPGETKPVPINLGARGNVEVTVISIVPDWSGLEAKRQNWLRAGRGLTPEIWFSVCSAHDPETCRANGHQRGINTIFSKELDSGSGSVVFFNFSDNPPVDLQATISY